AADLPIAQDLLDTLQANREACVGMAANMIGQRKRIIAFADGTTLVAMLNPRILERAGAFETEEGCLSLPGVRPATRYRTIKVGYQDLQLKQRVKSFSGWTAQIIQHEIDHCDGVVI
ncbi:MAG TPA: peptide deformylase, partial [Candidatus Aveggerthella excrementigallinarum]|nr:peptide deformylase [Candidatus Aveggerthella excrementigallinarum]